MPTAPLSRPRSSRPALSGTTLLIAFTLATLLGIVPIVMVGLYATWVTLAIAMTTLVSLAAAVIVLLGRFLGE